MTGTELENIRSELGLSIKDLAELLGTPYRTVQNWLRDENRIPGIVETALACLQREIKNRSKNMEILQQNELHRIRLDAKKISNQLCFLLETLRPMASESGGGPKLSLFAIRGLCDQLMEMENEAVAISSAACRVLGMPEETVEEEYS